MQGQAGLAIVLAQRFELLRFLGKQVRRAIEPECDLAAALQAQAPDLFVLSDGQCQLIELPIGAMRFQCQGQLFVVAHALGLQGVDPTVKLTAQYGVFPRRDLEKNSSSPPRVSALKCTLAGANNATVLSSCSIV